MENAQQATNNINLKLSSISTHYPLKPNNKVLTPQQWHTSFWDLKALLQKLEFFNSCARTINR
jgi:hypothetical protein